MATITGTESSDRILRHELSPGVTSDVPGLQGTADDFGNVIYALGGADLVRTGDGGDEVHGGDGNDRIYGGTGSDRLYGDAGSDLLSSGNGLFEILDGGAGADRMFGGEGQQFYVVDSYWDIVRDSGTSAPDDSDGNDFDTGDTIVTNLNYVLPDDGGVENLALGNVLSGAPSLRSTVFGIGNDSDNSITGTEFHNILKGRAGNDYVAGGAGSDIVCGGRGDDDVQGEDGRDLVRGQDGADSVWGGGGADILIGGRGDDAFFWNFASESPAGARDIIHGGDGAVAFEGAGTAGGDTIILPTYPGPTTSPPFAFDHYVFGGTGAGHINLIDDHGSTIVRVNLDDDPAFEFQIQIDDGAVLASAYTVDDFTLLV